MPMALVFDDQVHELERRGVLVRCVMCTRAIDPDRATDTARCTVAHLRPVALVAPRVCTMFEERR